MRVAQIRFKRFFSSDFRSCREEATFIGAGERFGTGGKGGLGHKRSSETTLPLALKEKMPSPGETPFSWGHTFP